MKIGVVGLGKLGLPLAAVLADCGFNVLGVDKSDELISRLNTREFKTSEPNLSALLSNTQSNLTFTSNYSQLTNVDIVYVIVPTPSDSNGHFLNNYIVDALKSVIYGQTRCPDNLDIVIVSTVMPGTCTKILNPLVRKLESELGWRDKTVTIIYSPEFIALGSVIDNLKNPDMLLVGVKEEKDCERHLIIQQTVTQIKEIRILNFEEAELTKLLVNCFVTMKISFANLIGEIDAKNKNIRGEIVAEALGLDTRIGSKYLRPGLGFGGPCFPRDNEALIASCLELDISHDLAIATICVNSRQPKILFNRILQKLNGKKSIIIHGISYKIGSDNFERSQMIEVVNMLAQHEIEVQVSDPLIRNRPLELDSRVKWIEITEHKIGADLLITHQKLLGGLVLLESQEVLILEY